MEVEFNCACGYVLFSAETEKELLLSEQRSVVDRDVGGKAIGWIKWIERRF